MMPPQQGFDPHDGAIGQSDLRLKVELKLLAGEGLVQLFDERTPRLRPHPQRRGKIAVDTAADALGEVERKIGIRQQLVEIGTMHRRNRDSGTRAEMSDV